jgi:NAD+ kinase
MRIAVHGRPPYGEPTGALLQVVQKIMAAGHTLQVESTLAQWLQQSCHTQVPQRFDRAIGPTGQSDVLISLGGDGTFLDAVCMVGDKGTPILGINLGRLGFLSNVRLDQVDEALQALAERRYTLEPRTLLELHGAQGFGEKNFALNEVSVHKRDSSSMITVHAYCDDRFVNTYWADGLIVSTATGSTAYSLSCGGPVLHPRCKGLVITPIAPHNLNVRPLMLPEDALIRLIVETRGDKYLVNLDSRGVTLDDSTELVIRRSGFRANLLQPEGSDFLDTLRTKLTWGLDVRSLPPLPKSES